MAAHAAPRLCLRRWTHCVRQRCMRVARSREDRALTIAAASRPQCFGLRAARIRTPRVALTALRLKSFASRSVPSETKNVHSFAYGNGFNLDQVCTTNGHEFNAKICSIFVYGIWSRAAEKWIVFGRQNPYQMLARILYHNLGVCLVSKYKQ